MNGWDALILSGGVFVLIGLYLYAPSLMLVFIGVVMILTGLHKS